MPCERVDYYSDEEFESALIEEERFWDHRQEEERYPDVVPCRQCGGQMYEDGANVCENCIKKGQKAMSENETVTVVELVERPACLAVFDPMKAAIAKYKAENEKLVFDYATQEKEVRSHCYKLRQIKGQAATVHKKAKATALAECQMIDGAKNEIFGAVDEMVDYHMKPINFIAAAIQAVEDAKLQAEKEAGERRHRELEVREAEIARQEAEMKEREQNLKAEQEAAMREAKRLQEAHAKAVQDKAEAEQRAKDAEVAQAKAESERAEREKRIATETRELVRLEAEKKAEAIKDAARLKEQQAADAEKRRVENEKHREKVEKQIWDTLYPICLEDDIVTDTVVHCIIKGKIPNVTINY